MSIMATVSLSVFHKNVKKKKYSGKVELQSVATF